MRKLIAVLSLMVMLFVTIQVREADAYADGLLDGKLLTHGETGAMTAGTTPSVTDRNTGTGLTMSTQVYNVGYTFGVPQVITHYQILSTPNTAASYNLWLYDGANTLIKKFAVTADGVKRVIPDGQLTGVRRVILAKEAVGTITVYEMDLFGQEQDITAPAVPTNVTAVKQGTLGSRVTWTGSASPDVAGYNIYRNNVKQNAELLIGTAFNDTGLAYSTTYTYGVESVDTAGNVSARSTVSYTAEAPPDTAAPDAPSTLTGSAGNAVANLSWSAVAAGDLAGYHVYRDGVQLTSALLTATSYQATGLENDRTYEFYVKAFDTSGNGSEPSNTVQVTPSSTMTVTLIPNGTSVIVRISGGSMPFSVTVDGGTVQTFAQREFAITGLARDTDYAIVIEDDAGKTYSETVNTGSTTSFIPPVMPDSTSLFQKMLNSFGTTGTIAIAVIGGAVALGVLIILGLWGWRLLKKWLASSK